jgi:hypothetical protein
MSFMRSTSRFRRTSRHLLSSRGQAVSIGGFRLIGERFLDASAEGVLVACDDGVRLGEEVIVSFPVPGSDRVFDAEAEVVRVVEGFRPSDPGYCAGLRFTRFDRRERLALGVDLRALPLAPQRIRWAQRPAGAFPVLPVPAVVLRSIVRVGN